MIFVPQVPLLKCCTHFQSTLMDYTYNYSLFIILNITTGFTNKSQLRITTIHFNHKVRTPRRSCFAVDNKMLSRLGTHNTIDVKNKWICIVCISSEHRII